VQNEHLISLQTKEELTSAAESSGGVNKGHSLMLRLPTF